MKQKGLCFRGEERYVSGHHCNIRQLYTLTIVNEDNEELEVPGEVELIEQMEGENLMTPQLSLHALTDTYGCQTTRLKGSKGIMTLFLLIDSGSSHNFLDSGKAKQSGCVMESIPALKLTAANGNEFVCNKVCRQFQWCMQAYQFQQTF